MDTLEKNTNKPCESYNKIIDLYKRCLKIAKTDVDNDYVYTTINKILFYYSNYVERHQKENNIKNIVTWNHD